MRHGTDVLWQAKGFNAKGQLESFQMDKGHLHTTKTHLADSEQVQQINVYRDANALVTLDYTWANDGNLKSKKDWFTGVEVGYTYDSLNRLTDYTTSIWGNTHSSHSVGYDALGNITSKTDASSGAYLYGQSHCGVTAGPHAVTNVPGKGDYCYDLNGNMTSGDSRSVQYNAFNKPTRIQKGTEVTQLHYGPSRQRYKRIDTGSQNRTTYYMGEYEKEVRADKTIHRIQLGDFAIVEKVDSNPEQIQYTIRDDLGSLIATVSDTGQIKRLNFDPWGKRLDLPVAESQPIDLLSLQNFVTDRGFTGHEHLDGSGLIHMNGRVYDPVIARFISADPTIPNAFHIQSYNRYAYVYNNPLRFTDPNGFEPHGTGTDGYEVHPNYDSKTDTWNHGDDKDNTPAPSPAVPESVKPKPPAKVDDTQPGWSIINLILKNETTIFMGYTKASGYAIHGKYHTFVIAVDPVTGEQYITRAGPTMGILGLVASAPSGSASASSGIGGNQSLSGSGFGPIKAQHDVWSEGLAYDKPSQNVYIQEVGTVSISYTDVVSSMAVYADSINAQSIGYSPTGPNSNSYAFSYVESLGLSRPRPALSAPGWDKKL